MRCGKRWGWCEINFENQLPVENFREHSWRLAAAHCWPVFRSRSMWRSQEYICQPLFGEIIEFYPHSCWPTNANSSGACCSWSLKGIQPWWFNGNRRPLWHARSWLAAGHHLLVSLQQDHDTQVPASSIDPTKSARWLWGRHLAGRLPLHHQVQRNLSQTPHSSTPVRQQSNLTQVCRRRNKSSNHQLEKIFVSRSYCLLLPTQILRKNPNENYGWRKCITTRIK